MSRGFKRLKNPRTYHAFDGRPVKQSAGSTGSVELAFGLLGKLIVISADAENAEAMTREQVPCV